MRAQDLSVIEDSGWRLVLLAADTMPMAAGRRLISWWGRLCSVNVAGYERTCERLIPGDDSRARVPSRYWGSPPSARARRFGVSLELDLRDNVQRCLYFAGKYEPATIALIVDSLEPGHVVLDVGAHVGVHSLAAAAVPGVRVISFEPMADSARALNRTVQRTSRDVEVVEVALGDRRGRLELRTSPEWGVHDAGVRSAFNTGPVVASASVVTFDEWNSTRHLRPNLVKIDVEGFELAVIRGMSNLLENSPPSVLVVELKDSLLNRAGTSGKEVVDTVVGFGYRVAERVEYNQVFRSTRFDDAEHS